MSYNHLPNPNPGPGPSPSSTAHFSIPEYPSYSASPSPAPSTPNGRPSKWTIHSMWTLITAYMNTHLTLLAVLKVVEAFAREPSDVPKEESAHKKISSTAGKELRWARANDVIDSISRLKSHILSPHFLRRSEAAGRPLRLKIPSFSTTPTPTPSLPSASSTTSTNTFSLSFSQPSRTNTNISIATTDSIDDGITRISTAIPDAARRDPSSRSFMKYLYILVTNVPHTLSSNVHHRPKPIDPTDRDADFRDSWAHDPDSPAERPEPTAVPWDLLRADDFSLAAQSTAHHCTGHEQEHERRQCSCSLWPALQASAWLQHSPLSQGICLHDLESAGLNLAPFADVVDCFGNTALHMLALRDVPPQIILHAATDPLRESVSAMNSLGQTFLHLLGNSWLHDEPSLISLLTPLQHDLRIFYGRDHYGRTFFHSLAERISGDTSMSEVLRRVMKQFNVQLFPDAFNSCPSFNQKGPIGAPSMSTTAFPDIEGDYFEPDDDESRPVTTHSGSDFGGSFDSDFDAFAMAARIPGVSSPQSQPHVAHARRRSDHHVAMHARLLATVNEAFSNPQVRDRQGRNALHCLGAAIFSLQTMRQEQSGIATGPGQRKRKHSRASTGASPGPSYLVAPAIASSFGSAGSRAASPGPPSLEHEDTSKERMKQRIETAQNLLSLGVDVNVHDVRGNTPLMVFAANSLENSADRSSPRELIKLLLDGGANVHARNRKGETALHIACRRGKKLAMRALIDGGANVDARDGEGRSVLDVLDDKFFNVQARDRQVHVREVAQFHVCRAVLAGTNVGAKQAPTALDEWRIRDREAKGRKRAGAKRSPRMEMGNDDDDEK